MNVHINLIVRIYPYQYGLAYGLLTGLYGFYVLQMYVITKVNLIISTSTGLLDLPNDGLP